MTTLNNKQAHSYSIAQQLAGFLRQSKRIHASFTPFHEQVKSLLSNLNQVPAHAAAKKKKGTAITLQKKALKKEIAADAAYLCSMTTDYALHKNDIELQHSVRYTYTDIFTAKDYAVHPVATIITNAILPLLGEAGFIPYGITLNHLTSLLEKANRYSRMRGKAKVMNNASDLASQNITATLKKITTNISRLKRLLPRFQHTHPDFVTGFQQALIAGQTHIRHNSIEGTITGTSTGEAIEKVNIIAEGKNKTATTAANGFYHLSGIKTGTQKLTITAGGYTPQTITVKVIRGKTITVNISLEQKPLTLPKADVA